MYQDQGQGNPKILMLSEGKAETNKAVLDGLVDCGSCYGNATLQPP
jgi:hypothetical protein